MATFQNVYYKRAVATAKPCFVCFKPTTTVLATMNATDFVYTCDLHLSDAGFASRIPEEPAKPTASTEEILKIKQEWDERQKRKEEKEKEKEKKDDKDKDKKDDAAKKEKDKKSPAPSTPSSPPAPAATPKHEKYTLHRDIFSMRQAEHRKRRNAAQAKEVAPRIPSAPRSTID